MRNINPLAWGGWMCHAHRIVELWIAKLQYIARYHTRWVDPLKKPPIFVAVSNWQHWQLPKICYTKLRSSHSDGKKTLKLATKHASGLATAATGRLFARLTCRPKSLCAINHSRNNKRINAAFWWAHHIYYIYIYIYYIYMSIFYIDIYILHARINHQCLSPWQPAARGGQNRHEMSISGCS